MGVSSTPGRSRLVRAALGALAVLIAVTTTVLIGAAGVAARTAEQYRPAPVPAGLVDRPAPPLDPAKPLVAIVVGARGAEVGDVLGPYDALAGAVTVLTVGPTAAPVPLTGGLDLVVDLTFAQLDELLTRSGRRLDAVVVPAMPDVGGASNLPVQDWLRTHRAATPIVLSICHGAGVVGAAGLLDGRAATTHWLRLPGARAAHPAVSWRDGVRYVDDGDLISTAGVLSGIDGALRLLERIAGTAAAADAAERIGWRHHRPGSPAPVPRSAPAPADAVALLNAGFRWDRPRIGVLVAPGVGELELASAFDPFGGGSFAAETVAVGGPGPVRTRHGLTVHPRLDPAAGRAGLTRLLVPGTDAAHRDRGPITARARAGGLEPEFLHERPGFPFDAALAHLARTADVPTARWTAKLLEYPVDDLDLEGPGLPWALVFWPVAVTAAQLVVLAQVPHALRVLRGRRRPWATPSRITAPPR